MKTRFCTVGLVPRWPVRCALDRNPRRRCRSVPRFRMPASNRRPMSANPWGHCWNSAGRRLRLRRLGLAPLAPLAPLERLRLLPPPHYWGGWGWHRWHHWNNW